MGDTRFETAKKDSVKKDEKQKLKPKNLVISYMSKTNILILKPILLNKKVIFLAIL